MASSSEPQAEPLLSVVIPAFNEVATIDRILAAVRAVDLDTEIIVVDDFSTDGTRARLQQLEAESDPRLRVLYHDQNQGKGAALRTGFAAARGQFVVVQDADLEYDPSDFPKLLEPLLQGRADVVFGSRFLNNDRLHAFNPWQLRGNRILTAFSNMFTRLQLTDMETCYKVFPREIIQRIPIREQRFGFEPEITAKLSRYQLNGRPLRFQEVAVSYRGRTNREGKKIGWKDGFRALWCIVKYSWL